MNKVNLTHEFCGICYISSLVGGREPHVFHLNEQVPTQFWVEIEDYFVAYFDHVAELCLILPGTATGTSNCLHLTN